MRPRKPQQKRYSEGINALANSQLALGNLTTILFTVLRVSVIYGVLLVLLRISGGRQFGQLTTIDLVTLLLLSNVVQNAMIGPDNSVLGGLAGAAALLVLYRVTTRLPALQARLEPQPIILVYQGRVLSERLKREGISVSELEEAAREHGVANLGHVETAVLEMNGAISVIPKADVKAKKLTGVRSRRRT